MKYGETLQQRSIPEWVTYNVDYNEIKQLIKLHTVKGKSTPVAIPGQDGSDAAAEAFETELYTELLEQHQRIDLFVRSKSGEIKRRLDRLESHVFALTQQCSLAGKQRISVRRLERFAKAESEILKVGQEVQSLARFVAAQRLAFVKLLKKHKKWTASSILQTRFETEVLRKPQSFTQKDFGPLLGQWTDVLTAVRAPFEAGLSWKAYPNAGNVGRAATNLAGTKRGSGTPPTSSNESLRRTSSASDLDAVCKVGSNVEFDTALATVPLGRAAGRAAYWIHPDNIIQLHILLLQYTRLRRRISESGAFETPPSSRSSRQGSRHGSVTAYSTTGDNEATINTVICDDPHSFAIRRNGATISDLEITPGSILEEAATSIRCPSTKGEAIVAICEDQGDNTGKAVRRTTRMASLKRKALEHLFSSSDSMTFTCETKTDSSVPLSEGFGQLQHWLQEHRHIQPLIHIQCIRSRFVGLGNNATKGLWATLDKDIYMERSSHEGLKDLGKSPLTSHSSSTAFPYAVLEVRWEGGTRPDLMRALDETHLAERIRGFSLETHAVAVICKPKEMTAPLWLTALNRDIRKIPAPKTTIIPNRPSIQTLHSSTEASNEVSSPTTTYTTDNTTDAPSNSVFSSEPQPESPATSVSDMLEQVARQAVKKKRRSKKERPLSKQTVALNGIHQRYWNEFDDGDEAPADEAYTILVDPNTASPFSSVSKLMTSISGAAKASADKVYAWLRQHSTPSSATERQALNHDYFSRRPTLEDGEIDSDLDSDVSPTDSQRHHRYATFPFSHSHSPIHPGRERFLFHCSIASFLASFTFLSIAAVLYFTTRRRYVFEADIGTTVGVVASLMFAAVAVGMMVGRREDVGWLHRGCVVGTFGMVAAGNGVLVARLLGVL